VSEPLIRFTQNHEDLSSERGYQFKFLCDKCGNGYLSKFVPSTMGVVGGFARAAGDLLGGIFGRAADSSEQLRQMAQGKAHDEELAKAVEAAKGHFKQCSRCGRWVCPEVCWNPAKGQCEECAPDLTEELASAQAHAAAQQIREKLAERDLTKGMDLEAPVTVSCPACGAAAKGGKFCPECGVPLRPARACPSCGAEAEPKAKFCPECGGKM
jgi:membrane protease subunit (stomatin/prohibitin family)